MLIFSNNNRKFLNRKLGDLIHEKSIIRFIRKSGLYYGGGSWCNKSIYIQFIKISKNCTYKNDNTEILGLLKLCLLKEISQKISDKELKKLPELIYCIMKLLSKGYITDFDVKNNIKEILKKTEGSNIINFSNFVDKTIDTNKNVNINGPLSVPSITLNGTDLRYSCLGVALATWDHTLEPDPDHTGVGNDDI